MKLVLRNWSVRGEQRTEPKYEGTEEDGDAASDDD